MRAFFLRLLLFFCIGSLSLLLTDNFHVEKIAACSTCAPSDTSLDPHLSALLGQSFHYMTKGSQSYVFTSLDGQYVLKVFKDPRKHLYSWTWLGSELLKKGPRWLFKTLHSDKREQKWNHHLRSLHLAASTLRQETGIVYAHLESTSHLKNRLTLIDKIHISHRLPLDTLPFVIQKKATPLKEHLDKLLRSGQADAADECLHATAQLLHTVKEKGLLYTDGKLDNLGVVEGVPILIDIGCIHNRNH